MYIVAVHSEIDLMIKPQYLIRNKNTEGDLSKRLRTSGIRDDW